MMVNLNELYIPENKKDSGKQVCMAIVKNEADIISLWLAHICELFDFAFIVDHLSTDGTREFLLNIAKATDKIYLYSFEHPGYFQSEITNELARIASQEHPGSWLFALDADEFIAIKSKTEFSGLLQSKQLNSILRLNWRNCLPIYLNDDRLIRINFSCLYPQQQGIYDKVAVHSETLTKKQLRFIQGNHHLETISGELFQENLTEFLNIYHIPVRSMAHFAFKCAQGYVAYKHLPPERNQSGQGTHWANMIEMVVTMQSISADLIRKYVATYGQPNNLEHTSIYDLIDMGWQVSPFTVPINQSIYSQAFIRKNTFMEKAQSLLDSSDELPDLRNFINIVHENIASATDVSEWQKENKYKIEITYSALPEIDANNPDWQAHDNHTDIDLLHNFFSKAFTKREFPVPSTWEGHVPFLYCILHFIKPRRFVELGSQYGNCYFAACQTSKILNNSIECIAVDTWAGDEHTGKYQDDVFQQFNYIRSRNYPKGKYIRKLFSDAVSQFENGSIDLLHIDGLHTYEAVHEDYQTWLSKLSDYGIIMFHDTQVRERGFGVWQLWAELQYQYPSLEFDHSHGLGVILIGKKSPKYIQRLFALFDKPDYRQLIKSYFSNIGNISPITIPSPKIG
jgi:hypothetical protein